MKKFHINVQKWISNFSQTSSIRHRFTEAVVGASRLNTTITEGDYRSNPNGTRKLTIKYFPPICELNFDCSTTICDTGQTVKPTFKDFYIRQCSRSPVFEISAEFVRNLDDIDENSIYRQTITNAIAAARKTFNMQLLSYFILNLGRFPDGEETKVVTLINPETRTIDPFGNVVISSSFEKANLGRPIVVGGDQISTLQALLPISGQNQLGLNTGGLPYDNYFYDQAVNAAFGGGEHLIAFDPQVLKFVSYNVNTGQWATNTGGYTPNDIRGMFSSPSPTRYYGTIIDPLTDILWDFDARLEDCVDGEKFGVWKFQFSLLWDVFFIPDRVCNDQSVNGVFHFTGCDIVPTSCPKVEPQPKIEKVRFAWTPPEDCYPKFINTIKLGNTDFTVDVNVNDINELVMALNTAQTYKFSVEGEQIVYFGFSALKGNINEVIDINFDAA